MTWEQAFHQNKVTLFVDDVTQTTTQITQNLTERSEGITQILLANKTMVAFGKTKYDD